MQPHPLGGLLPTPTHLKGLRIKPTACHRSFRLRWWSGWHRGVLRRFAGGVWVLLALSGRRRCPQSKCQAIRMVIARSLAGMAGTAQMMVMTANRRKTGSLLMRQAAQSPTPIRLRGTRTRPIACLRSSLLKWWSGWHRSVLRGFAGWGVVLLALSAKRPCPQSKCRSMGIPPANGSDQNSGEGVYMALMGIPGEDFRLCLPAAPSLTPIRLRGLQIKPTTCRHFSPFTWSCAPHDHVKAMKRWQICSRLYASGQRVGMGLPPASITGVCGGGILPEHG